jgi:hypothetical protein
MSIFQTFDYSAIGLNTAAQKGEFSLPVTVVNAVRFFVSVDTKAMVADRSDFSRNLDCQLDTHTERVGFEIYNPKTGNITRWYKLQEVRDPDGDLQVTIYAPAPETEKRFPHLVDWTVHILND